MNINSSTLDKFSDRNLSVKSTKHRHNKSTKGINNSDFMDTSILKNNYLNSPIITPVFMKHRNVMNYGGQKNEIDQIKIKLDN